MTIPGNKPVLLRQLSNGATGTLNVSMLPVINLINLFTGSILEKVKSFNEVVLDVKPEIMNFKKNLLVFLTYIILYAIILFSVNLDHILY